MKRIIESHNPAWKYLYEKESDKLKNIFKREYKSLNHIGSTSVEGLGSQPIIDMSIGMNELQDKEYYAHKLGSLGYKYANGSAFEEWILFKKYKRHKFHLHIMPYNSKRLVEQIIFKLMLQNNPDIAKMYEQKKRYLVDYDDPLFYHMAKEDFVNEVVKLGRSSS